MDLYVQFLNTINSRLYLQVVQKYCLLLFFWSALGSTHLFLKRIGWCLDKFWVDVLWAIKVLAFFLYFQVIPSLNLSCFTFSNLSLNLPSFYWNFWNLEGQIDFGGSIRPSGFWKYSILWLVISKKKEKNVIALCRKGPTMGPSKFSTYRPQGSQIQKAPITRPSPILDHWFESTVKVLEVLCWGRPCCLSWWHLGAWALTWVPKAKCPANRTFPIPYQFLCLFLGLAASISWFHFWFCQFQLWCGWTSIELISGLTHIRFHLSNPFCKK